MMVETAQLHLPHIISIPFPLYGHITPMLILCRRLAASGISLTLLVSHFYHSKLAQHLSQHPCPGIHLVSVTDSLPSDFQLTWSTSIQFLQACEDLRWVVEPLVEKIATNLMPSSSPPLYILSDVHLAWAQDIANKLHIPRIALWTSNAAECQVYFHASRLLSQGHLPFTDATREVAVTLPGLPPLQPTEFPSFLQLEDANDPRFSYFVRQVARMEEADMVLINSFVGLEKCTFAALREGGVKVHPVGPLFLLQEGEEDKGIGNMHEEQDDEERVLTWLDTQLPKSVLFVAFGSFGRLTHAKTLWIARVLEEAGQPFLWALRGGGVEEAWDGFMERTKGKGMVVEWVRQKHVLKHPSVGGFLTHCGWNSTLESISMGVPMLCCPIGADQILTAKMVTDVWKVGLRLWEEEEGTHKLVREMICGELGKEMRAATSKLGHAARNAVEEGGSSLESFRTLENIFGQFTKSRGADDFA